MSTSPYASIVVGVPVKDALEIETKQMTRDRFDPESGEKTSFEYEQLVVKVFGQEVPFSLKKIPSDYSKQYPEKGYDIARELYHWLSQKGFGGEEYEYTYSFEHFASSYKNSLYSTGFIGLKVQSSSRDFIINFEKLVEVKNKCQELFEKAGFDASQIKVYCSPSLC